MGDEINHKIVLFLAILVLLVVAVSAWLTLNKLSSFDNTNSQAKVVYVTEKVKEGPSPVGKVTLTILPTPAEEGGGA